MCIKAGADRLRFRKASGAGDRHLAGEHQSCNGACGKKDFKKKRVFPVGPADPAVAKVNDIYKKVIYIKTKDYQTLVELKDRLEHYMRDNRAFKDTVVQFDFNPMSGF